MKPLDCYAKLFFLYVVFFTCLCPLFFFKIASAANLIQNPGFESGTGVDASDWITVSRKPENFIQWISDDVYSGNRAIKIVASVAENPGNSLGVYTDFIPVPEDVCIEISAWLKAVNIVSRGSYYRGRIVLYYYNCNKKKINQKGIQITGSIQDWTKLRNYRITPVGTQFVKVGFFLTSCTGIMLVDDVELAIARQAPIVSRTESNNPVIIPTPWKTNFENKAFNIGSLAVVIDTVLGEQDYLEEEIKDFFLQAGISKFEFLSPGDPKIKQYRTQFVIGDFENTTALISQFKAKFPESTTKEIGEHGYFLSSAVGTFQNTIYLAAKTEQGRFYGFQTLKQVLNTNSEPKAIVLDILDTPTLKQRGIAMGVQWFSKQEDAVTRLSQLKGNFIVNQGSYLNSKFLYKWREDFTSSELAVMVSYLSLCKKHFVVPHLNFGPRSFNPNVNPVTFSSDIEINLLAEKIKTLYASGFRNFGLNFDDLQNVGQEILLDDVDKTVFGEDIGKAHSSFTQAVYRKIKESCPDIVFSVIPMNYNENRCITDEQKKYLVAFASLPSDIKLIACLVTDEGMLKFKELTKRTITIWSNFMTQFESSTYSREYTWPYQNRMNWSDINIKTVIDGLVFLPIMPDYEDTSLVSWKTVADFMWSPVRYDFLNSFQNAMTQYKGINER